MGGKWPELARKAATALSGSDSADDDSAGVMLLTDLQTIFKEDGALHIASNDIVNKLVEIEERSWSEWYHQKPITPRQLARLLKPFGVTPATVRIGSRTAKGYRLEDFHDAFSRYIPISSVTRVTLLNNNDLSCNSSVTSTPNVMDKNRRNAFIFNNVTDVTDKKGVLAGVADNDDVEVFEI